MIRALKGKTHMGQHPLPTGKKQLLEGAGADIHFRNSTTIVEASNLWVVVGSQGLTISTSFAQTWFSLASKLPPARKLARQMLLLL